MFDYSRATEAQKQVLDSKDKNVLVSAAAGSGKTTVMIEKIVRLILDSKISIQNFYGYCQKLLLLQITQPEPVCSLTKYPRLLPRRAVS